MRARIAAAAFVLVYLLAVWTPFGQRFENSLVVGYADQARIFSVLYSAGPPPLRGEWATLLLGMVLLATITVVRRQWLSGLLAGGVVVLTVGVAEAFNKVLLPRPDLSDAPRSLTEASFPSGHVAIVAGLSMGVVLIAAPRWRPGVAALGAVWLAVVGAGVQALYWHRPSDVLGATLLAVFFGSLARVVARPEVSPWMPVAPRGPAVSLATPAVLVVSAVGAYLASSRSDAVGRPLVFAAVALLCAGVFWSTARAADRVGGRWGRMGA